MPTIDWKATWVMLTGGRASAGIVSRPRTGVVNELRAITEPSRGMSMAHRTSPSMSRPPRRSGEGRSVSRASSNAASLAGCVSWIRMPST
jgi:hypothetical protein